MPPGATPPSPKSPNIATVFEPTVYIVSSVQECNDKIKIFMWEHSATPRSMCVGYYGDGCVQKSDKWEFFWCQEDCWFSSHCILVVGEPEFVPWDPLRLDSMAWQRPLKNLSIIKHLDCEWLAQTYTNNIFFLVIPYRYK